MVIAKLSADTPRNWSSHLGIGASEPLPEFLLRALRSFRVASYEHWKENKPAQEIDGIAFILDTLRYF